MSVVVSLRKLADELNDLMEGSTAYLNRQTGEIFTVSDEEVELADEEDDDLLPDWQRELMQKGREVVESEDWLALPTKFDIHEWAIMEEFSRSVEDRQLQDELLSAIQGRGAFRHFRETVSQYGIENLWYAYKAGALEQIATDWLDEHGIAYRRETDSGASSERPG
jgi:uncharacterized protein UPF0158